MSMPPGGHPLHPQMVALHGYPYPGPASPIAGRKVNSVEQEHAWNGARQRLGEWLGLAFEVIRTRPETNAKLAHLHFISEGMVMLEDRHAIGQVNMMTQGRKGPELKRAPDPKDIFARLDQVNRHGGCPLHGTGCVPHIKRQALKPFSVTYEARGWKIGESGSVHNGGGRGDSDITVTTAQLLLPSGEVVLSSKRTLVTPANTDEFAVELLPDVSIHTYQDPAMFDAALDLRLAHLRAALESR